MPNLSKLLISLEEKPNALREIMRAKGGFIFAGGWGNHDVPDAIHYEYFMLIDRMVDFDKTTRYCESRGKPELNQLIAEKFEKEVYKRTIQPENVISGLGSTTLTSNLFRALLDPKDVVLVPEPTYLNYSNQLAVDNPEVKLERFKILSSDFEFLPGFNSKRFLEYFENRLEEVKPKLLLLPTPDNPTGRVWPNEVIKQMLEITNKKSIWLVLDLAYRPFYFQQKPAYYEYSCNEYGNLITVHSFSKEFSLLGYRFGYVTAVPEVVNALEIVQEARNLCPDTLHQMAIANFINDVHVSELQMYFSKWRKAYKESAGLMVEKLREKLPRAKILEPDGGFYVVIDLSSYGVRDSWKFARELNEKTGVLTVPGAAFGESLKNGLRLSHAPYVKDLGKITEGVSLIGSFVKELN